MSLIFSPKGSENIVANAYTVGTRDNAYSYSNGVYSFPLSSRLVATGLTSTIMDEFSGGWAVAFSLKTTQATTGAEYWMAFVEAGIGLDPYAFVSNNDNGWLKLYGLDNYDTSPATFSTTGWNDVCVVYDKPNNKLRLYLGFYDTLSLIEEVDTDPNYSHGIYGEGMLEFGSSGSEIFEYKSIGVWNEPLSLSRLKNWFSGVDGKNFKPSFPHPYRMVKIENRSAGNWNIPDKAANDVMFFSTLPSDNGYGESIRTILNKDVKIGAINSTVSEGVEKVGSMTFSISNLDKFYSQMVEANTRNPFQNCIISVYECSGRVAGLFYDGSVWKDETGSTRIFTPSVEYPFTDAFEKTFEGRVDGINQSFDRVSFSCVSAESEMNNLIGNYQLDNGNPTSKSEISPIVIGDLSDGVSPILLTRKLEEYPKAILSENTLDATTQGQLLVYDDESEKLHDVKNKQSLVNTNTIEFYDKLSNESISVAYAEGNDELNSFVDSMGGEGGKLKILRTDQGEMIARATNGNNYRSTGAIDSSYSGSRFFDQGYTQVLQEGSRDFNKANFKASSNNADLADTVINNALFNIDLELKATEVFTVYDDDDLADSIFDSETWKVPHFQADGLQRIDKDLELFHKTDLFTTGDVRKVLDNGVSVSGYPHVESDWSLNPSYLHITSGYGVGPSGVLGENNDIPHNAKTFHANFHHVFVSRLGFNFEPFKFKGKVKSSSYNFSGGFYSEYDNKSFIIKPNTTGIDGPRTAIPSLAIHYDNESGAQTIPVIDKITDWGAVDSLDIDPDLIGDNALSITTIDKLNTPNIQLRFLGYVEAFPSGLPQAPADFSSMYIGYRDRFALDGCVLRANVDALVDKKFVFAKPIQEPRTTASMINGFNELFSSVYSTIGSARNNHKMDGVLYGSQVLERDLLRKVANEFYLIVNNNGNIYPKGYSSTADIVADESNIIGLTQNTKFGELGQSGIFNKFTLFYAKNNATGKYDKKLSVDSNGWAISNNVSSFSVSTSLDDCVAPCGEADHIVSGDKEFSKKLDWVRDDFTAGALLKSYCLNMTSVRTWIEFKGTKLDFFNSEVGQTLGVNLGLPQAFEHERYQITEIRINSDESVKIKAEEFLK